MNTNRLTINNIDLSTTLVDETSAVTGYTVVKSKGGSAVPVKFTGSSKVADFAAIFGTGGKDEPDVYEAYTFLNAGYDLYVSAPYTSAEVPVAAVTDKGIMMLSDKIDYSEVENFATGGPLTSIISTPGSYMIEAKHLGDYFEGVSVSNTTATGFEITGESSDPLYKDFVGASLNLVLIKEDGIPVEVNGEIVEADEETSSDRVTYTFEGITSDVFEKSCLYIKSGKTAAASSNVKVRGYIFPKFPTANNITVDFAVPSQVSSITVSNINNTNISFALDNMDMNQVYICYMEKDASVAAPALKTLASLSFRGCKKECDSVENGWEKALEVDDSIDLFFDPACHDITNTAPKSTFFGLAEHNRYMGLAGYIFNATADPSNSATIPVLDYGPNYWSICNQAVINPASANSFYSSMVGARAVMQARIIEKNYGGSAPMYINDSNGLGGQLGALVGSSKLRYSFKDPDTRQKFASKNYNVVISDPNYGVLITSQMTCKSGALTDWSYIGHACAFLNLQKLIWDNVMIPQVGKANNPYYRELRAQQVQRYLDVRTGGSNSIWAAASVDTSTAPGVNDAAAQKARKFVLTVKVRVNIFSEEVTLNFVNLPQDATL